MGATPDVAMVARWAARNDSGVETKLAKMARRARCTCPVIRSPSFSVATLVALRCSRCFAMVSRVDKNCVSSRIQHGFFISSQRRFDASQDVLDGILNCDVLHEVSDCSRITAPKKTPFCLVRCKHESMRVDLASGQSDQ